MADGWALELEQRCLTKAVAIEDTPPDGARAASERNLLQRDPPATPGAAAPDAATRRKISLQKAQQKFQERKKSHLTALQQALAAKVAEVASLKGEREELLAREELLTSAVQYSEQQLELLSSQMHMHSIATSRAGAGPRSHMPQPQQPQRPQQTQSQSQTQTQSTAPSEAFLTPRDSRQGSARAAEGPLPAQPQAEQQQQQQQQQQQPDDSMGEPTGRALQQRPHFPELGPADEAAAAAVAAAAGPTSQSFVQLLQNPAVHFPRLAAPPNVVDFVIDMYMEYIERTKQVGWRWGWGWGFTRFGWG
jgi:hypothetical protein